MLLIVPNVIERKTRSPMRSLMKIHFCISNMWTNPVRMELLVLQGQINKCNSGTMEHVLLLQILLDMMLHRKTNKNLLI